MRSVLVAIVAGAFLAACGSNGPAANGNPTTQPPTTPTPSLSTPAYTYPPIDPTQFTTNITNQFLPFPTGSTYIFQGTRDGVPLRIEVTVTTETKTIMGVKCIVVRDIVTGALEERTTDWYAQDNAGNVWYFGEDTAEYTNGVVTSRQGSWTAGVNGAKPGIVMHAPPPALGAPYLQEYRPAVAEDMAQVVQVGASVQVPAGSYTNVVVTKDTDPLNPGKLEHKYYAPGVGMVYSIGVVNGHHEEIKLTQILHA